MGRRYKSGRRRYKESIDEFLEDMGRRERKRWLFKGVQVEQKMWEEDAVNVRMSTSDLDSSTKMAQLACMAESAASASTGLNVTKHFPILCKSLL